MGNLTVNELKIICDEQIAKGNGNKKVLLSDDDEGNGYHGLYFHFTPITKEFADVSNLPIKEKEYKDYIILG